jgi:hypothetical protein
MVHNNKLVLDIKTNVLTSIAMLVAGLIATTYGFKNIMSSWWWLIAIFFGLGFILIYSSALIAPKRLILLVVDNFLYVHFASKNTIEKHELNNSLMNEGVFLSKFEIDKISHLWKYKLKINHATAKEVINIEYKGDKKELIDLGESESNLTEEQLSEIISFMKINAPHISFSKP